MNGPKVAGLRVLQWLAGFAGAVVLFVLANRRIVTIAWRFARWELRDQWVYFASILGATLLLPGVWLLLRWMGIPVLSPRLLFARYWRWSAASGMLIVATVVLLLFPYVQRRYYYFSEASYQVEALAQLEAGSLRGARSTCTEYLSLYPQRQVDSSWPDPVCAPILTFTDDMGYIGAYLKNRPTPQAQMRDGVWLPVDFSVRAPAMTLIRELAGGRVASAEPTPRKKTKPAVSEVDEPAEGY